MSSGVDQGRSRGARGVLWIRGISRRACGRGSIRSALAPSQQHLVTPHQILFTRRLQWREYEASLSLSLECYPCLDEGKVEGQRGGLRVKVAEGVGESRPREGVH